MQMPILALFKRALREESRNWRTYGGRAGLLLVLLIALLSTYESMPFLGAPGRGFFMAVTIIDFFYISLIGLNHFAGAIAEEREEMTLGLLRMTRLSPVAILLGKSTSRVLSIIMLLLVQVPLTLLAVTMGGVAMGQVAAAYATLIAYAIFLSGIGLFFSVICQRVQNAAGDVLVTLLAFFFLPPLGAWLIAQGVGAGTIPAAGLVNTLVTPACHGLQQASALQRLIQISTSGFAGAGSGLRALADAALGVQVISNVAVGAVLFLISWLIFDHFTREAEPPAPARGLALPKRSWLRVFSPGRVRGNAIMWKEYHFGLGGRGWMVLRFIVIAVALTAIIGYMAIVDRRSGMTAQTIGGMILGFTLFFLGLEVANQAARVFNSEVRWETLSSISILPVSTRALAYRKVLGCLPVFVPYLVFIGIGGLLDLRDVGDFFRDLFRDEEGMIVMWWFGCEVVFNVHLIAFFSLVVKRGGLAVAILVSWVGQWLVALMAIVVVGHLSSDEWQFLMFLAGGGLLCLAAVLHYHIGGLLRRAAAA